MRRKFLYLLISILAFELGVLGFIKFYQQNENNQPQIETATVFEIKEIDNSFEQRKTKQPEFVEIAFKNLPCEDEKLKPIWNLLNDRTVSINTDYIERIKDCTDLIEPDYLVGSNEDGQTDLNNDRQKEIFIRSHVGYFCGNNCQVFWVFQKDNEQGYRKLFEAMGYMTVVENKRTKGYKDIRFIFQSTYNDNEQRLYKFNGTEYVPIKCWSESKLYKNKAGEFVERKRYKTEYHDCKEPELIEWN